MKTLPLETFVDAVTADAMAARRPEGVTFELTYGCNLRCLHCYNPTHRMLPSELTTIEIRSILDQIAALGVLTVTFTGGEPTARPDIVEVLQHARSRGLMIHLLTNATRMTTSFAAVLQEAGVSHVTVSIYGATSSTYERMTGIPGSHRQFLQGLRCLATHPLPVTVRMPVTTVNQEEVHACRTLVEQHGFKFQYCLDIMPGTNGDSTPLRLRLSPADKQRVDDDLRPHTRDRAFEDPCVAVPPSFINCACGQTRFAITPYGKMNLCVAFPIPQYDLRTGTVREGWELLKRTVDMARPNEHNDCPTCEVSRYCRQGRSDAWLETGDMSACLPHFKRWAELESEAHALLDPRRPA
jgi:radical SAM protein with 4Fe4S-binding SPASM domain